MSLNDGAGSATSFRRLRSSTALVMSTVREIEKSGAVAFDSAIRRLTVCCRRVSSWISASPFGAGLAALGLGPLLGLARLGRLLCGRVGLGAVAVALGLCAPLSAAACTSAFTIRPPGPEPSSWASSTPSSRAMRRATGDAFTRSPSPAPLPLGARVLVAVPPDWVSPPPSPPPPPPRARPSRRPPRRRRPRRLAPRPRRAAPPRRRRPLPRRPRPRSRRRRLPSPRPATRRRRLAVSARLARVADARDRLADRQRVALLGHDLDQRAVGVGVVGHVGLVGLDLHERLAALDLAALLDQPLEDGALLHRVGQARHRDVAGHPAPLSRGL